MGSGGQGLVAARGVHLHLREGPAALRGGAHGLLDTPLPAGLSKASRASAQLFPAASCVFFTAKRHQMCPREHFSFVVLARRAACLDARDELLVAPPRIRDEGRGEVRRLPPRHGSEPLGRVGSSRTALVLCYAILVSAHQESKQPFSTCKLNLGAKVAGQTYR